MKLVIHCGLHKTGTSSFQHFCANNRDLLRGKGLHYPEWNGREQHSYLLHVVQKNGLDVLRAFLSDNHAKAIDTCHTVLISGEDFENCIVDLAFAAEVEQCALDAGFVSIEWVVVTRDMDALLPSLYSQLSSHKVILREDSLYKIAHERGCFYLSTEDYSPIFVLDFARFAERFRAHVTGSVWDIGFKDFVADHAGMVLLQRYLEPAAFEDVKRSASYEESPRNPRKDETRVEIGYIATFLGTKRFNRLRYRWMIAPLLWLRMRNTRHKVS